MGSMCTAIVLSMVRMGETSFKLLFATVNFPMELFLSEKRESFMSLDAF